MSEIDNPKFELSRVPNTPVENAELICDIKRIVGELGKNTLTLREYGELGNYDGSTITRRFGSWNKALTSAGLQLSNQFNISDEELFENILRLWEYFGRQPRRSDLAEPPSTISQSPYKRRFGSWSASLYEFVEYANGNDFEKVECSSNSAIPVNRKSSRDPSLRLRWKVLQRDNFKCCACGASPAITSGVELHVDHIQPWSKNGETTLENLQTLCSTCNLGKSNEVKN